MNSIVIGAIGATLTALVTLIIFLMSKKKNAAETENVQLDNLMTKMKIYDKIINEYEAQLKETQEKLQSMQKIINKIIDYLGKDKFDEIIDNKQDS